MWSLRDYPRRKKRSTVRTSSQTRRQLSVRVKKNWRAEGERLPRSFQFKSLALPSPTKETMLSPEALTAFQK